MKKSRQFKSTKQKRRPETGGLTFFTIVPRANGIPIETTALRSSRPSPPACAGKLVRVYLATQEPGRIPWVPCPPLWMDMASDNSGSQTILLPMHALARQCALHLLVYN